MNQPALGALDANVLEGIIIRTIDTLKISDNVFINNVESLIHTFGNVATIFQKQISQLCTVSFDIRIDEIISDISRPIK